MHRIKICHWNANGLTKHKLEVYNFLLSNNIDIMLISETHLTDKNYFRIPEYLFYDTKHPRNMARGGTAILIKKRLKHSILEEFKEEYLQSTIIQLQEFSSTMAIAAVYCPPSQTITEQQFKDFFAKLGPKFMAAGDFNAKHHYWGSRLVTPRGRKLFSCILRSKLDVVSTGQPTYWPSDRQKMPDLIDFGIIKGIDRKIITASSSLELSSDHSPSIITMEGSPCTRTAGNQLPHPNLINWLKYKKYISTHIKTNVSLKNDIDIDRQIYTLTELMHGAIRAAVATNNKSRVNSQRNIDETIEYLVKKKRELRRSWQQYRSPKYKKLLYEYTVKLRCALKKEKERQLHDFLSNLTPTDQTDYALWKATKNINRPIPYESPIRLGNGNWARTDSEKGCVFAEHLQSVFTPNQSSAPTCLPLDILQPPKKPIKFKKNKIVSVINQLKPKKAPGYDKITPKMLKELPNIAVLHISHIFNAISRTAYYPKAWKLSQITMIGKPGKDLSQASSYRPISLLSILSKLFEKLLLQKIMPFIQDNNIIPQHQFGFRAKHSTTEQVHRIVSFIRKSFEKKQYCTALFLDVAQAFDKVWHRGLIHKITSLLPTNVHLLLQNYITNREFVVKQKDFFSRHCKIDAGVPQGSVLGPILYVLYTSDMPTTSQTMTSTFADDTAILCTHTDPKVATSILQRHILETEVWLKNWRIKVNETKCVHITFTLRKETCPAVTINGQNIPQQNETKYLGIHLDRRLTWRNHIEKKVSNIKLKMKSLYWMLNSKSALPLEYKVLLYKAMLKPIWTYGIEMWGTATPSNIEKLQRVQSKALRIITGAPWYIKNANIHRDICIPRVADEIVRLSKKYLQKLEDHPNKLARNLLLDEGHTRLKKRDIFKSALS